MDTPPPNTQPSQMNPFKCPALVGIISPSPMPNLVRELSEDEIEKLKEYTKVVTTNRKRFALFRIVKRNYEEWLQYTTSLLKPVNGLNDDELGELDRLMLNFLSAARSLIDHFAQYYKQAHRNTPDEEKYSEYMTRLETHCWAFAFFQDLRNFTQHCGLPTGHYSRTASRHAINLKIVTDAKWLLKNYNGWGKSTLTEAHGELDLIELTQDYYVRLTQDLGGFVAKAFAPTMLDAHNFFASLTHEVKNKYPNATMAIADSYSIQGNNIEASCKFPPSDLFGSLGITVTVTQAPPPETPPQPEHA